MMRISIHISSILILFSFLNFIMSACQNKDSPTVPTPQVCKISRITGLNVSSTNDGKLPITVEGKAYTYDTLMIDTYDYDAQGRIVGISDLYINKDFNTRKLTSYRYRYSPDTLYATTQVGSSIYTNYYLLTSTGLINAPSIYKRDAEGHVISYKTSLDSTTYTFANGNVSQSTEVLLGFSTTAKTVTTSQYEFDLTKSTLPAIYQFEGTTSKNLLTRQTWHRVVSTVPSGSTIYTVDVVYTFIYTYDDAGRIKRRITKTVGTSAGASPDPSYYIEDYQYTCK